MAGSWMSIVNGFAGMRAWGGALSFNPTLPKKWKKLSFRICFQKREISVDLSPLSGSFRLISGDPLPCTIKGKRYVISEKPVQVRC